MTWDLGLFIPEEVSLVGPFNTKHYKQKKICYDTDQFYQTLKEKTLEELSDEFLGTSCYPTLFNMIWRLIKHFVSNSG